MIAILLTCSILPRFVTGTTSKILRRVHYDPPRRTETFIGMTTRTMAYSWPIYEDDAWRHKERSLFV